MKIPRVKKEMVIERLAKGQSVTAAGEAEGISRRTIHWWLANDDDFRDRVDQKRQEHLDQLRSILSVTGPNAAVFLANAAADNLITTGPKGKEEKVKVAVSERIRAANYLLDHLGRWSASTDVLIYAQRVGDAMQKALSKLAPEDADEVRMVLANELYRARVPSDSVAPITRKRGKRRSPTGDGGDNPDTDPGAG